MDGSEIEKITGKAFEMAEESKKNTEIVYN